MKKIGTFCAAVVFLCLYGYTSVYSLMQNTGADGSVACRWTFAAKTGSGENRRLTAISRDTILHSGDEIKMMVHLEKKSYFYVINKSSKNEISVLYPYALDAPVEVEKNMYIPKGRGWFKLDKNIGDETFYILASQDRLIGLEAKLRQYDVAAQEKKNDLAAGIVAEIKEIKKKYRQYASIAERPISIAGNVRGTKTGAVDIDRVDIATLATQIYAPAFFSKTITIEHK